LTQLPKHAKPKPKQQPQSAKHLLAEQDALNAIEDAKLAVAKAIRDHEKALYDEAAAIRDVAKAQLEEARAIDAVAEAQRKLNEAKQSQRINACGYCQS
jgi:protein-disulfide isomerase-like protein with CxxC motif